jgi:lysophospholipase L1-like esterase
MNVLNDIKYFFVSGDAFFGGAGLIILACLLGWLGKGKRGKHLSPMFLILGFLLVLVSTTPMSGLFYGIWVLGGLVWLGGDWFKIKNQPFLCAGILVLTIIGVGMEWPYRWMKTIPGQFNEVYLVGDSISQGIGKEKQPWPAVMAEEHKVKMINLAIGGSTAGSAMSQAKKIDKGQTLVLLEIGGNDLLQYTPPTEFRKNLDALLGTIRSVPGRTLVMFELPLFPSRQVFGTIQRELAAKYQVILIPKRYFAGIILGDNATVDGIHLSDTGHQRMAEMVWDLIGPSLVQEYRVDKTTSKG